VDLINEGMVLPEQIFGALLGGKFSLKPVA
jgi:hypothetical protein